MSWFRDAQVDDRRQDGSGPGFVRYTREEFERLNRQHNILALVGNGFDIQTLHDYKHPIDSRYETFYHHLKMRGFDQSNLIFEHMENELLLHQREGGHNNWSDIEAAVGSTLAARKHTARQILEDLRTMQAEFAQFLQAVAPSDLLDRLGSDASDNGWGLRSLSEFLGDLEGPDFVSLSFPGRVSHYDLFNFQFVNFNYTTLLDDYVYLDQTQFDPLKYTTVDTHFLFKNDPRSHWKPGAKPDAGYSGYVVSNVVHPHGILSTPRSLLFGIDSQDDYKKQSRTDAVRLGKPYWSQAHALYRNHFLQADLFIIFGCSLGESDGWWWRNIVRGLRNIKTQTIPPSNVGEVEVESAELIIYRRQDADNHTVDSVKDQFLEVAQVARTDPEYESLAARIHVVIYDDESPRSFLSTRQ